MLEKTLIIPDTGPDFLQAIRLASLYSDQVHVFTLTNRDLATQLQMILRLTELDIASAIINEVLGLKKQVEADRDVSRVTETMDSITPEDEYLQFCIDHSDDLTMLKEENILRSITDDVFSRFMKDRGASLTSNLKEVTKILDTAKNTIQESDPKKSLRQVKDMFAEFEEPPPCVSSLMELVFHLAIEFGHERGSISEDLGDLLSNDDEVIPLTAFAAYLLTASYISICSNLTTMTWDRRYEGAMFRCHEVIRRGMPNINHELARRATISHQLGKLVLEEEVPNVSDLPFDEILDIRRRRGPELEAFRAGLRQLAADIDPTLSPKSMQLAVDEKIATVVKPAVRALKIGVSELQLDAYKRLFPSAREIEAAVIPAVLSLSMNPVPESTAMLGTVAVAARKLYEFIFGQAVDKKKLLEASPWSILYRIQQKH